MLLLFTFLPDLEKAKEKSNLRSLQLAFACVFTSLSIFYSFRFDASSSSRPFDTTILLVSDSSSSLSPFRFRSQQLRSILRSLDGPKPISRSCFLSLVVSKPPFPYRASSDIFPNLVFVVYLPVFCPILSEILTWNFLTIYLYLF